MRGSRIGLGAMAAGALAAGALAFAPAAMAVTPAKATANYDCGSWGGGTAELNATQSGSGITIQVKTAITTPIAIGAGDVTTALKLTHNGTGAATFTGSANPAIPAFGAFDSGVLTSTTAFAAGDTLDSYFGDDPSLTLTVFGTTVECFATSVQDPGPFVAD
ncbi:hypothetical protein H9Y04_27080 [Streptomyces sp. TRM66268-LWL]|uniref:Uncharacterized protein n=1 Tax=Streptomyces polyasparticus TaxID=2767826 RepID=A0ABR7SMJ0_9ACTN|nr:hypothetical protein [Streptomyces polyasparticus]MBC9716207.1 hypothetical protein [Streptomyces polyasparticus]